MNEIRNYFSAPWYSSHLKYSNTKLLMERRTIQEDGTRKSQNSETKSRKDGENGSYMKMKGIL